MIKERYCSYEVARLLKEKGFDEECHHIYVGVTLEWTNTIYGDDVISNNEIPYVDTDVITAPTHQMACDWLQETHNLFLNVGFGNDVKGEFLYMVDIYDLSDSAVHGKYKPIVEADDYLKTNPKTVGDAIEAALKYSLENLV